jgi:hypothetical protein
MREAPARGAYRRAALERALRRCLEERKLDPTLPRASGVALIVMQRAFLAAEDLARLMIGLEAPPSWERLTDATLPELDSIIVRVLTTPQEALRPFVLPTPSQLEEEEHDRAVKEGVSRLVQLATARWLRQLETVARFWLHARGFAKATMHGFPLIAGSLVTGPPPAGALTDRLKVPGSDSWALALLSEQDHQRSVVETTSTPIPLDESSLQVAVRAGKAATRVAEAMSEAQATSIAGGYGATVPLGLVHRLPSDQQKAIEKALAARREDAGDGDE